MIQFTLGSLPFPTYKNFMDECPDSFNTKFLSNKITEEGGTVINSVGKTLFCNYTLEMPDDVYLMFRLKYD